MARDAREGVAELAARSFEPTGGVEEEEVELASLLAQVEHLRDATAEALPLDVPSEHLARARERPHREDASLDGRDGDLGGDISQRAAERSGERIW